MGENQKNGGNILSTHDLTRRSTIIPSGRKDRNGLSTHDLTRRSTADDHRQERKRGPFNSRPHKEVDSFGIILIISKSSFNSRPHKEVDDIRAYLYAYQKFFQLTTSQGGRHAVI